MVPKHAIDISLASIGASEQFIDWVHASMAGHRRLVQTRCGIDPEDTAFDLAGLPQGCCLSPVLWCCVVDVAMKYAQKNGGKGYLLAKQGEFGLDHDVYVTHMAYADDLVAMDETKAGLLKKTQAMVSVLACFNVRMSPKKCIYMWSSKVDTTRAMAHANINGLQTKGGGTLAQDANGRFTSLDPDGTIRSYSQRSVSDIINGQCLDDEALNDIPGTIIIEGLPIDVRFTHDAKDQGTWAATGTVRGKNTTHKLNAIEVAKAIAHRQQDSFRIRGISPEGVSSEMECSRCAPACDLDAASPEGRGATRYLGIYLSFLGWTEQQRQLQGGSASFFEKVGGLSPTLRQYQNLTRSLLTARLLYARQVLPSSEARTLDLRRSLVCGLLRTLGLSPAGGPMGRTAALVLSHEDSVLGMGICDPEEQGLYQDLNSLLVGLETENDALAAATWVALNHGLTERGTSKALTNTGVPWYEVYDTVLSRVRNLAQRGFTLHAGGGKRRGGKPESGDRRFPEETLPQSFLQGRPSNVSKTMRKSQ